LTPPVPAGVLSPFPKDRKPVPSAGLQNEPGDSRWRQILRVRAAASALRLAYQITEASSSYAASA
jgi:hypothetical protein